MTAGQAKARSRGESIDMSPQALSRRLDILVELDQVARLLGKAKRADAQAPVPRVKRQSIT